MNSQELRDQLHPYLDGELDPEQALEVERALEEHPECRAELRELEAVQLMARAALEGPVVDVDLSHLSGEVMARLETEGALRRAPEERRGLWDQLMALFTFEAPMVSMAAAAAIVALVVGAMAISSAPTQEQSSVTNVAETAPAAPAATVANAPPIGKRRGPELESGRHAAFVEHIEAARGRVVVDANTDDPSKPMVVWHHVDEGGALPIESDSPGQEL